MSPPNPYPLGPRPISRVSGAASSTSVRTIVPTFPAAEGIHISPPDVPSIRQTPGRYVKRQSCSSLVARVINPLELLVDEVAARPCKQNPVTAQALYDPVIAHVDRV
jgi:hypothetical protein